MNRENIVSPVQNGLAYAVNRLQTLLFDNLPWIERGYGLASDGFRESAEKVTLTVPEVYVGNGRYQDVLPDGQRMGHFFFYADGPEKVEEFNPYASSKMSCQVSLIVWVDLDKISRQLALGYDHRFTDELIDEAMGLLVQHGQFKPSSVERKATEVWKNWTVGRGVLYYGDRKEYAQTQVFKHPEAGFRITGTLYYDKECQPLPDITGEPYSVPATTGHHHDDRYALKTHSHAGLSDFQPEWGDLTGDITQQSDLITKLGEYALTGHTHDYSTVFAALNHDHDTVYAPAIHSHDYAATNHTHDYSAVYAPLSHHHDNLYYTIQEVDDYLTGYALASHTHDYSSVFAPLAHDHDEDYSQLGHTHTQYAADDHAHAFSEILLPPTTLAGYGITDAAPLSHDHNGVYSPVGHTHDYSAVYAPLSHDHDSAYATASHTHTLDGLSDVVLTSPASGQVLKYNGTNWINDTDNSGGGAAWGSITGTLSSQTDLQTALNGKAAAAHNHDGIYEPVIGAKGNAFNTSFGISSGEAAEGDHSHLFSKTITVEAVTASESIVWFYTHDLHKLVSVAVVVTGSVTFNVVWGSTPTANTLQLFSGNKSMTDAYGLQTITASTTINSGCYVRVITTASSGTTPMLHITLTYSTGTNVAGLSGDFGGGMG